MAKQPNQKSSECKECIRQARRIKSLERKIAKMSRSTDSKPPRQLYYDEKALAMRLGLSVKTLQNWRLKGQGPRWQKIGRCVRYRLRDTMAFERSLSSGGGNFE